MLSSSPEKKASSGGARGGFSSPKISGRSTTLTPPPIFSSSESGKGSPVPLPIFTSNVIERGSSRPVTSGGRLDVTRCAVSTPPPSSVEELRLPAAYQLEASRPGTAAGSIDAAMAKMRFALLKTSEHELVCDYPPPAIHHTNSMVQKKSFKRSSGRTHSLSSQKAAR